MPSIDQLIQILTHPGQLVLSRRDAAIDLGDLGDSRAVPFLEAALKDASALVRREAARSLGKLDASPATSSLLLALAREPDEKTRRCIVETLGRMGTREAIPALKAMSEARSLLTRAEAQKGIQRVLQRYPDILEPDVELDEPTTRVTPSIRKGQGSFIDTRIPSEMKTREVEIELDGLPSSATKVPKQASAIRHLPYLLLFLLATAAVFGVRYFQRPQNRKNATLVEELSNRATRYLKEGELYFQRGDYENAIVQYEQALLLQPTSLSGKMHLHRNLGFAYFQQGRYALSAKMYEQVVQRYPADAVAYNYLGTAYMRQGQSQLAYSAYRRALEIQPDFAPAYNNLALLYANRSTKQLGQAEILARRAIQLEPGEAGYYDTSGWILYKQGRINRSIEALEKAIRLRSDLVDAHYHLALAAYKANQRDRAMQEMRIVFYLEPNFNPSLRSPVDSSIVELIRRMAEME